MPPHRPETGEGPRGGNPLLVPNFFLFSTRGCGQNKRIAILNLTNQGICANIVKVNYKEVELWNLAIH
jgi:hypothetical protein